MTIINTSQPERVVVGLSGGVDSSVAALLLREQGYDVHGVFMKNWSEPDDEGYCSVAEDLADAEAVAETLSIPMHVVDFSQQYKDRVFKYFLNELSAGRTPNPDILCNTEIKFHAFLEYALSLGATRLATGHYAQAHRTPEGAVQLHKAADRNKDQTYFLHGLNQQQLALAHFPLGELVKNEVRDIAEQHDLITFDKKDSTGICFIGERDFRDFIRKHLPTTPGKMRDLSGNEIGEHMGLAYYTIGQRHGLGIGGTADSSGEPWFVAAKDMDSNTLTVVQGSNHPNLFAEALVTETIHWIDGHALTKPSTLMAKTRYRQADQACTLYPQENGRAIMVFDTPQRAITPGQYLVLYDGERCLGGGIIEQAISQKTAEAAL